MWYEMEYGIFREEDPIRFEIRLDDSNFVLTGFDKRTGRQVMKSNIMNRDPIFVEQEADLKIKQAKENGVWPT